MPQNGQNGQNGETEKERLDRELIELLNELRVALPGVQVLFAFMLTVPFSGKFDALTDVQTAVFGGAFLATAVATVLLMFPTAYHRIRFRQADKGRMLPTANVCALIGLVFLAVGLSSVVFLVVDLIWSAAAAGVLTALLAGLLGWLWFAFPLARRLRDRQR